MKPKLLTATVMLAALALGIVGGAGAHARSALPLISSPWSGGMSAADQAASAATRPTFADANWNHEVCAIAYFYEGVPQEIARRRSALRPMHKENTTQTEERRRLDELERKAAEHRRQSGSALANPAETAGRSGIPAMNAAADRKARNVPILRAGQEGKKPWV